MFEKHLWKSDILSKDAGNWTSKKQLSGFYKSGILVESGSIWTLKVSRLSIARPSKTTLEDSLIVT